MRVLSTSGERLLPHPKRPWSMIVFVFLPTVLGLLALVAVWRISWLPFCGHCAPVPANVHEILASAANHLGHGSLKERQTGVQTLAHFTRHCPNLAPATVPYLAKALADPEPSVKGAAAISLGWLGPHATSALPALHAAKGSSVVYFDYLLGEAVSEIRGAEPLAVDDGCTPVTPEAFEKLRVTVSDKPPPQPVWRAR